MQSVRISNQKPEKQSWIIQLDIVDNVRTIIQEQDECIYISDLNI